MNLCIRCAYCTEECPMIQISGWDSDGARGKVLIAYGLLTGQLEPDEDAVQKLFECTTCSDCIQRCPSGVSVVGIIESARAGIVDAGLAGQHRERISEYIIGTGNIYGEDEHDVEPRNGSTPLFLGCQYRGRPNAVRKFIFILEEIGIDPMIAKEKCCGYPLKVLGFRDKLADHKARFETFDHGPPITLCPTCTIFLEDCYGIEARHILDVMLDELPELDLGIKATYHDPCDLSRKLGMTDIPRKILSRIGVELVEMEHHGEESACCGGGGGMLISSPETAGRIAQSRVRDAIATGTEVLITACPTCEAILKKASSEICGLDGNTIKVRSLEDMVLKALKKG